MNRETILAEIETWPPSERMRLIEDVWDGLAAEKDSMEPSVELKALLDQRIEALDRDPTAVVPWEAVEARALARFQK